MRVFTTILMLLWTLQRVAFASTAMNCAGPGAVSTCCCAPEPVVTVSASCCGEETPAPKMELRMQSCGCEITADTSLPAEPPLVLNEARTPDVRFLTAWILPEWFSGAEPSVAGTGYARFRYGPPGAGVEPPLFVLHCSYRC